MKMINVALPKGRLGKQAYALFSEAGYTIGSIDTESRKLTFANKEKGVHFFWVKATDVAIYVERGAADIGIVGKDVLLEQQSDVYELLDLNIGKCRMAVAFMKDYTDNKNQTLRVATKYENIAREYFRTQSRQIDIIKLNGMIEIAPILGLADVIVDIVETGRTLKENDLISGETIVPISARLIGNKVSYKFMHARIEEMKENLKQYVVREEEQ
jgi:ATP phosphoribosyltransferase